MTQFTCLITKYLQSPVFCIYQVRTEQLITYFSISSTWCTRNQDSKFYKLLS